MRDILGILAVAFIIYVLFHLLINAYFARKQAFMDYTVKKAKELKYGTSEKE